jgi:glycosyltransferase involved in cell wall biosynthesis
VSCDFPPGGPPEFGSGEAPRGPREAGSGDAASGGPHSGSAAEGFPAAVESPAGRRPLRILLVSQFWPGEEDPDYGVFVAQVVRELEARGHVVDRAVVDRRGAGRAGDMRLLRDALRLSRRRPDVVFAHFLVPAGLAAAAASLAARAPLVVMAHGQDVENAVASAAVRRATALVVRRAHTVLFNSAYLRGRLPLTPARSEVVDCGVDLARFAPRPRPPVDDGPVFLFAGSLIERKNVVRLRDAFERLGRGRLIVLGDGPLRSALEGRSGIELRGRVAHDEVPDHIAHADVVVLPSEREPLGQILLEAMAMERSVVATTVGGPAGFVTPEAGVLVDPSDVESIRAGLERAAGLPSPNPAARTIAAQHDVRRQAARMEAALQTAARTSRNPHQSTD